MISEAEATRWAVRAWSARIDASRAGSEGRFARVSRFTFISYSTGRSRILALRGEVCAIDIGRLSIGSIVGFESEGSRGRDPSPCWFNRQRPNLARHITPVVVPIDLRGRQNVILQKVVNGVFRY